MGDDYALDMQMPVAYQNRLQFVNIIYWLGWIRRPAFCLSFHDANINWLSTKHPVVRHR